jgi:hypothetical protein
MFLTQQDTPPQRLRRFGDTSWQMDDQPVRPAPFAEIGHSFSATLTLSLATVGAAAPRPRRAASSCRRRRPGVLYLGGTAKITAYTDTSHVTVTITTPVRQRESSRPMCGRSTGSPQTTIVPSAKDPIGATITLDATAAGSPPGARQMSASSCASTAASCRSPGSPRTSSSARRSIDSDAFAYTLASDQINPIMHLASGKVLFAFTYGGEFTIKGGVEKPITPTNVQVESQAAYGAANVRSIRVGKEIFYIDQSALQLLAFTYDASDEDYDADDLTLFAEHISGSGFVDLTYQRKPDPIVWAPRTDGVLPSMSISRKQQVQAWSRQITDGLVESVATVPMSGGHQTWALVQRTVNGATVRYVERFDPAVLCDSAVTGTSVGGQSVLPVGHLQAKAVDCVADGRYMGRFTVVGGNITLPRNAFAWTIGLPYTSRIKLLTPEIGSTDGSAQGNAMSTHEVVIRFLSSYAAKVNGKDVAFRQFGTSLLDQPLVPFTGLKKIENLGWELGASDIEITSDLPLAFNVLAAIRKFTVNAG